MASQGFNPGYAHARNSMVGTPDLPDQEWLGDKWFDAYGTALKPAEQQKSYMHLWTDFARRASYINSMGTAVPDVLLYNPLESAWIHTHAAMLDDKT